MVTDREREVGRIRKSIEGRIMGGSRAEGPCDVDDEDVSEGGRAAQEISPKQPSAGGSESELRQPESSIFHRKQSDGLHYLKAGDGRCTAAENE
jgi:hypothetical protein